MSEKPERNRKALLQEPHGGPGVQKAGLKEAGHIHNGCWVPGGQSGMDTGPLLGNVGYIQASVTAKDQ